MPRDVVDIRDATAVVAALLAALEAARLRRDVLPMEIRWAVKDLHHQCGAWLEVDSDAAGPTVGAASPALDGRRPTTP